MKRKITLILITIAWMMLIFMLSSQNGTETAQISGSIVEKVIKAFFKNASDQNIEMLHHFIRKFAHVFLFFTLGLLVGTTVKEFFEKSSIFSFLFALSIVGFCGFFDEWHKQFIQGRHFDFSEVIINVISALCALVILFISKKSNDNKYCTLN